MIEQTDIDFRKIIGYEDQASLKFDRIWLVIDFHPYSCPRDTTNKPNDGFEFQFKAFERRVQIELYLERIA